MVSLRDRAKGLYPTPNFWEAAALFSAKNSNNATNRLLLRMMPSADSIFDRQRSNGGFYLAMLCGLSQGRAKNTDIHLGNRIR